MTYECVNADLDVCRDREHPHPCGENDVETRMILMQMDLSEIKDTLDFVMRTIVKADTTITKVAAEVMPTVDELMKSPILKMLGMKK